MLESILRRAVDADLAPCSRGPAIERQRVRGTGRVEQRTKQVRLLIEVSFTSVYLKDPSVNPRTFAAASATAASSRSSAPVKVASASAAA